MCDCGLLDCTPEEHEAARVFDEWLVEHLLGHDPDKESYLARVPPGERQSIEDAMLGAHFMVQGAPGKNRIRLAPASAP